MSWSRLTAVAGACLFLCAVCAQVAAASAEPVTKSFPVASGSASWLSTGITLKTGQTAKIAISGNAKCGAGDDCPAGSPTGSGHTCASRTLGPLDPGPAPDVNYGAVGARLSGGAALEVGASRTVTGPGTIELVYNDCSGYYADNSGAFTAAVTYTPGADEHLKFSFSPSSADGSGTGAVQATITDVDDHGNPVSGSSIAIEPPYTYGGTTPNALVCDESNALVYPTRTGGAPSGAPFTRTTDAAGQIHLTIYPGTAPGEFLMDAYPEAEEAHNRVFGSFNVGAGGSGVLPAELTSLLLAAGDDTLAGLTQPLQRTVLDWLSAGATSGGALAGVAYLPINAVDAKGATNGGIVLYANSPAVRQRLLAYLSGTGAPPSETEAVVMDVLSMAQLRIGTSLAGVKPSTIPYRLPTLAQWSGGTAIAITDKEFQALEHTTSIPIPARGPARLGAVGASGNEDLLYGEGPYPPAPGSPGAAAFAACTGYSYGTTITPHSPVRLLAVGQGGEAGQSAAGGFVDTLSGAIVRHTGARLQTLDLAAGTSAKLSVVGTGSGKATLVFSGGKGQARVFSFHVRRGERGTVSLSGGLPSTMRFGGSTLRAAGGVGLEVRLSRRVLRRGRKSSLTVTVRDQFGSLVSGVTVALGGKPLASAVRAQTGAGGKVSLAISPTRAGSLTLRVSAPGYAAGKVALRVR